jgi:hypothetical protein
MKFRRYLIFFILLTACFTPPRRIEKYKVFASPDYSHTENWAALPDKKDSADVVPPGSNLKDEQANALADVFFIHPTLYFKGKSWNAAMDDKKINALVDKYTIRQQASIFNGSCKVYAPRYRQATLASFTNGNGSGQKAIDLAYEDIKKAFEYFLSHYNKNRPFIIAGHSQGAWHGGRLIKEYIDNNPELRKRFIAAYLIGGNTANKMFVNIPDADSASQTGCCISWHVRKWGTKYNQPKAKAKQWPGFDNVNNYLCVNPLSWKRDTTTASAILNLGSVPKDFSRIDKGIFDAKISQQGIIWTHASTKPGYLKGENYHVQDMSLYWLNIRENVALRVKTFIGK